LRSEIPSGICAKLRTVAASNNRDHMPRSLYYCLFAPHICMVLFFTPIPFVVNHTINATPPERLQQDCDNAAFSNPVLKSNPCMRFENHNFLQLFQYEWKSGIPLHSEDIPHRQCTQLRETLKLVKGNRSIGMHAHLLQVEHDFFSY